MKKHALFSRINYIMMYAFARKQNRMMLDRADYLKHHFIEDVSENCPSPEIACLLWKRIQKESALIGCEFKPKPSDLLGEHFGIANEDLRDLVVELTKACGKESPPWEEIEVEKINTVGDLAKFLYELRDAEERTAEAD